MPGARKSGQIAKSSYARLRNVLARLLVGYFVLGLASFGTGEIFPIFSWFLFARVPGHVKRYELVLDVVRGHPLPKPVFYDQADGLVADSHSIVAKRVINSLGKALDEGDLSAIARVRRALESDYLPPDSEYTIVEVSFEPLRRWRSGEMETRELAHFRSGE